MKKHILPLLMLILLAFSAAGCRSGADEGSASESRAASAEYATRTARFYALANGGSFWYEANRTDNGTEYVFTQAARKGIVTTVEKHRDGKDDIYMIFDGSRVDYLEPSLGVYDTTITRRGQGFLFSGDPHSFESPISAGESALSGREYYCEAFITSGENGESGVDKYYFDGERLAAVSVSGRTVMFIRDYSADIPGEIYLSVPEGYKKRNFNIDIDYDTSVDTSGWWGD